jgi:Na+(H+)/acetate symporter ActP
MSAYLKIPLQALILLTGVFVFAFYLFVEPPMLFNPVHGARVAASGRAAEYRALEEEFRGVFESRREAAGFLADDRVQGSDRLMAGARAQYVESEARLRDIRGRAMALVRDVTGDASFREESERNYVFPTFIMTRLPVGLVGLLIAAIFAAAMSSIAAELNSLATASVIDIYRRHLKPAAADAHYLAVSKGATLLWGLFACVVAAYATRLGSLIEVVNRFGSFFYGSLLGVFVLAIGTRRASSRGAFWGLLAGMAAVAAVAFTTRISFLWYNVVGVVVVVAVGLALSGPARSPEG